MALLVTGAVVATCGYILLFCVALAYVVIGGYAPGGGRFLWAGAILTAVGHLLFLYGRRTHPAMPSLLPLDEENEFKTEADKRL